MGQEERERKFEQALARHLRRDAVAARSRRDARADVRDETHGADTCPDAGTLAAFHEGVLMSEEMNATTEHIAGCSRCQQILLLLEATDEIPLQVEAEKELQIREPVLLTGALDVDYAARQEPSISIAGQPKQAFKAPKDISVGRGFKALRWAAPAGAIAAGLLIWIVARDSKMQTQSHVDNAQVAREELKNEQLAATPPSAEADAKTKPRKDHGRIKQPAREPRALSAPKAPISDSISSRVGFGTGARPSGPNAAQVSRESRDEALQAAAPVVPQPLPPSELKDAVASAGPPTAAPETSGDARAQSATAAREGGKNAT